MTGAAVGRRCRSIAAVLAVALAALAAPAGAVELRVLSAGAVEPGIRPALAAFERDSGDTVRLVFAAAPALRAALRAAEAAADVIIVPQGAYDELVATGSAGVGPAPAPIGRVGIGVAVRPGAVVPDIATADALKDALARTDSVVFNRASTGVYVEHMLRQLGIADAVNAKSERFGDGAAVMRRLLAGTQPRELGFGAMTEIALFRDRGLKLVGPLPAGLQSHTTYVALPWPGTVQAESARAAAVAALMRHLQGDEARAMFIAAGIEASR